MEQVEVTQQPCPKAHEAGMLDTHHLVPRSAGNGAQVMACRYCGLTESELRAKPECDSCKARLVHDRNGWWVGEDGTSDCPSSERGHTVGGRVR